MIRLALLGCGEHSRSSHAAPLARYAAQKPGEIELVAACDLNFELQSSAATLVLLARTPMSKRCSQQSALTPASASCRWSVLWIRQ